MRLRLLISTTLAALALQTARAQSADDYFHGGAQAYLTNNMGDATNLVNAGLKKFPDDVKLKKLDALLKQQQQQQSQQQQQQQNQQQKQSQQNQSQSKSDQQKKQDEQKQKDQQKQQDQQKQNQKQDQDQQGEKPKPKEQQGQPAQMTPEEAKQLLDSQKGDEMLLPANHKDKQHDREHPLKDW